MKKYYFLLLLFIFPIIIFANAVYEPSALIYSAGKFFALSGFLCLSILIISGDTARFFDRFFGMDKIIKFQRKFSFITTSLIILHPILFIVADRTFIQFLIPRLAFIELALGATALYLLLGVMIASKLYKRISNTVWQYIHIITYVLYVFAVIHALRIGSDTHNTIINIIIWTLIVGVIIGSAYRIYYKLIHRNFRCHVDKIISETDDTFTLRIRTNKRLEFKEGQFCFLRIDKDKLYARHPFTISSPPTQETLDFTIKLEGRFTQAAHKLKPGDEIFVEGPFGLFTPKYDTHLVFIAGGVGITPFMSIIRSQNNKHANLLLLYGSRTYKDIIFYKELEKMTWLNKRYFLSQEKKNGFDYGYIDKQTIKSAVRDIRTAKFYICGPEPMKNVVIKALRSLGVKNADIYIEDFFW